MKILFYNPTSAQKRFVPFEAIKGSAFFRRPNYDAMRLAYLSKKHTFIYFDERIEEKPELKPDLVVVNVPLTLSRYVTTTIRNLWPKPARIILYGFYPTLCPQQAKKHADTVVTGDIANIWDDIIRDAQHDALQSSYTSNRKDEYRLDRTIEEKYGFTPVLSQLRTSFGCTCHSSQYDYCYERIIYKDYTQWKLNEAAKEVSRIRRKIIFLRDDDFLYDLAYAMRFLEKCWRYKKMWILQTKSSVFAHNRIFSRLRDTGVRIIHLKEDWLGANLHENISNREFLKEKRRQIGMIHYNRIACGCQIRLGYEGEDFGFYRKLLEFLKKIRIDFIKLAVRTPIPGSETFSYYHRKKQITQDLSLYDQWMPVVHAPDLSPQALYSWMEWLRDRFYSWDSIILRNVSISARLGLYNTIFFYFIPNFSYRNNFLEKVGYPP